jgi:hypothetical protein
VVTAVNESPLVLGHRPPFFFFTLSVRDPASTPLTLVQYALHGHCFLRLRPDGAVLADLHQGRHSQLVVVVPTQPARDEKFPTASGLLSPCRFSSCMSATAGHSPFSGSRERRPLAQTAQFFFETVSRLAGELEPFAIDDDG